MSEEKKSRFGLYLGVGCLGILVLTIVGAVMLARGVSNWATGKMNEFTQTNQVEFPTVVLSPEQKTALDQKIVSFRSFLEVPEPSATNALVLTSDEVNTLLDENKDLKEVADGIHVSFESNRLTGEISLPIHKFIGIGEGRYLNGKAVFAVQLAAGRLQVFAESVEVNGKPLSAEFMGALSKENLAKDFTNAQFTAFLEKLQDIRVVDGRLELVPRAAAVDAGESPEAGESGKGAPADKTDGAKTVPIKADEEAGADTDAAAKTEPEPAAAQ